MHYRGFDKRTTSTPQTPNNAGGLSWKVDDATLLKRFLILGTQGGSFYVSEPKMTRENLTAMENLLQDGSGLDVVRTIVEISQAGRAISNDPALFALARCSAADNTQVRAAALAALPEVARTGTHLLHFVAYVKQFRGWGRGLRRAVSSWFQQKTDTNLVYQLIKYQQRDDYSQRDLLRLAHPKAMNETYNAIYRWVTQGWEAVDEKAQADPALQSIWAFEKAKHANEWEAARLIHQYHLPREAIPTQHLTSPAVWEMLLERMPLEAMIRNLATMTRVGLLTDDALATDKVIARLEDSKLLKQARLHPLKIFSAWKTYQSGHGVRGHQSWTPVKQLVHSLEEAFYTAFHFLEPLDQTVLLAIDVSGSMKYAKLHALPHVSAMEAATVLAMALARMTTNKQRLIIGFDTRNFALQWKDTDRFEQVFKQLISLGGGGTDCSLPFQYALKQKVNIDSIVTLSDNETWYGNSKPYRVLERYRNQEKRPVRAINVQMTATRITNRAPDDALSLEAVGFDTSLPELITSFIRGAI